MPDDNSFSGEITITPPLTWVEILGGPALRDVCLRTDSEVVDSDAARTTVTTAGAIIPVEARYDGRHMVTDIQAIVDHYGMAHTFAGWIQMQPDPGYGESTPQRYIVVDGRVETVTPTLVWPGEEARHFVLDLPMGENDAQAGTIREYLIALLAALWDEQDGFDGKRPFGNSGWDCDLLVPLIRAGLIDGRLDEDGYIEEIDDNGGEHLIAMAIQTLGGDS